MATKSCSPWLESWSGLWGHWEVPEQPIAALSVLATISCFHLFPECCDFGHVSAVNTITEFYIISREPSPVVIESAGGEAERMLPYAKHE